MADWRSTGDHVADKGTQFEDSVEAVYRLLGASVTRNVLIHGKKVDILATFPLPAGSGVHRVIVECKNEGRRRAQNQRAMELKGLLETARAAGTAESAEIVTMVAWSDAAKGFARDAGIGLFTYREKISSLLDLRGYLRDVIVDFAGDASGTGDEPPLAAYYVKPVLGHQTRRGIEPVPFDEVFGEWLAQKSTGYHLAILGGYGLGKSALCRRLAHDLARQWLARGPAPNVRIPILIDLRRFTKTLSIEALIVSFLDERCGVANPRFRLFEMMNSEGFFVLLLDGFDEMAVRVDADTLELNIVEIEKLAASSKARLIITSRDEYFINTEEQSRLIRPLGGRRGAVDTRKSQYLGLSIALWSDQQVGDFLRRRIPLIPERRLAWTEYQRHISKIPGLSDLAQRPVLLSMIVQTLPELIESGREIKRANLYDTYLHGELRRQKFDQRRRMLLPEKVRLEILEDLAVEFVSSRGGMTFRDARERIGVALRRDDAEIEGLTRDFLTCSFLIREHDEYRFSHRSIMEYLAARGLRREIDREEVRGLGRAPLTAGVASFLMELEPPAERLWRCLQKRTRAPEERFESRLLETNAGRLLVELEALNVGLWGKNSRAVCAIVQLSVSEGRAIFSASVAGDAWQEGSISWSDHGDASLVQMIPKDDVWLDLVRSLRSLDVVVGVGLGAGLGNRVLESRDLSMEIGEWQRRFARGETAVWCAGVDEAVLKSSCSILWEGMVHAPDAGRGSSG